MPATLSGFKTFSGLGEEVNSSSIIKRGMGVFPDPLITSFLSVSEDICRDMCGLEEIEPTPDNERFTNAIYLLAHYFLQNRDFQEFTDRTKLDEIAESTRLSYYRANVREPLMKQILGMLSKFRKVSRFIPDPSESA